MPPAHKPMLPILTRPFALVASVALMTLCADTLACDDAFQPDAEPPVPSSVGERSEAEWSEGRVTLPPWPQDGDLPAFTPEGTSGGFRLYIDSRNLSIDPSGDLVRYTLVAESATKLVMHIAIAVAALAVLASLGSAIGRGSTGWALASQILTIVLCGTLVLFAIRSFLTARRSQPQDGLTSG